MQSTDEIKPLVEKLQEIVRDAPTWERKLHAQVWRARVLMFIALALAASLGMLMSDDLATAMVQAILGFLPLFPTTRLLIAAETNQINAWRFHDECRSDLRKYTLMLECERAQATTDERPSP